jgi:hypothetical protein
LPPAAAGRRPGCVPLLLLLGGDADDAPSALLLRVRLLPAASVFLLLVVFAWQVTSRCRCRTLLLLLLLLLLVVVMLPDNRVLLRACWAGVMGAW